MKQQSLKMYWVYQQPGCQFQNEIRLLIVDDVERVRQNLRTYLTLTGEIKIVSEGSNGLDAIYLAETLHPQVILMDLEMPVLNGYETTRQIKASQPFCRIIALTIHDGEAERERADQPGADDFIIKGPSLDRLLKSIHEISTIEQMPKGGRT